MRQNDKTRHSGGDTRIEWKLALKVGITIATTATVSAVRFRVYENKFDNHRVNSMCIAGCLYK
jgi:hypothetical protein